MGNNVDFNLVCLKMDSDLYHFNVKKQLQNIDNTKDKGIRILREWVQNQTEIPETSDILLFQCLHSCYFDVERTKAVIQAYHSLRESWPEVFRDRNPTAVDAVIQQQISLITPLKKRTPEGYKVFYCGLMDSDSSKFDMDGQLKLFFSLADYEFMKEGVYDGIVLLLDNKDVTWKHVPKFSLTTARKLLAYVQDACPVRLKGIHIINSSLISEAVLAIAKVFMNEELKNIIYAHSEMETLYKYVPDACLPKDYGGKDASLEELHENMKNLLLNLSDFFQMYDEEQSEYFIGTRC